MRRSIFAVLAIVPAVAVDARAQEAADDAEPSASAPTPEGGRVFLGIRSGEALALGAIDHGAALADRLGGHVPIWLDVGYKLARHLMLGLYGEYGFGLVKEGEGSLSSYDCLTNPNCPAQSTQTALLLAVTRALHGDGCLSGMDCSGWVVRFGAQIQYEILAGRARQPVDRVRIRV